MSILCFVCGEDSACVKVDGGWNRRIHVECKPLYPLAQEYGERYTYQRTDTDDAVLFGMEKAAQLLGTPLDTETIVFMLGREQEKWNEWKESAM